MTNSIKKTNKIVAIGMFSAIAYLCTFVMPIKVSFLTFDIKDAVITIGALYFGPISAVVMAAITSLLEFVTISSTGVYGLIMNFISSATFCTVASLLYSRRRTLANAAISLAVACLSMTSIMLAANMLITPYYMGVPQQTVQDLLLPLLLPFNLCKSVFNAGLIMILYRPISVTLKKTRLLGSGTYEKIVNKNTIIVLIPSVIIIAAVALVFFLFLDATI